MANQSNGRDRDIVGAAIRRRTIKDYAASRDATATEPIAPDAPRLKIRATGNTDSVDPVRYWSVFDVDRRIGRVCLICLPDHVGAVLGLWAEQGQSHEIAARQMLIDAAFLGLHRAACVKVIADASVEHEPAWRQIIARGALTPRPGRGNRRWHEYYVNIYQWRDENAAEACGDCESPRPTDRKRSRTATGAGWGTPLSPGTGDIATPLAESLRFHRTTEPIE